MTIKGKLVYIGASQDTVIFGRKRTVQSNSVSKMAVFRKFKGLHIKYSYLDFQKTLSYPERRRVTYVA